MVREYRDLIDPVVLGTNSCRSGCTSTWTEL